MTIPYPEKFCEGLNWALKMRKRVIVKHFIFWRVILILKDNVLELANSNFLLMVLGLQHYQEKKGLEKGIKWKIFNL